MSRLLSSLNDSVALIYSLINVPNPSRASLERLARNYRHIEIILEKPEVINGGEPLTMYVNALESAATYLEQYAPDLLL
jgi:hypothetical protein